MTSLLDRTESALVAIMSAVQDATGSPVPPPSSKPLEQPVGRRRPHSGQRGNDELEVSLRWDHDSSNDPNIRVLPLVEDEAEVEESPTPSAGRHGFTLKSGEAKDDDPLTREKVKKEAEERVRRHAAKLRAREQDGGGSAPTLEKRPESAGKPRATAVPRKPATGAPAKTGRRTSVTIAK